MGFFGRRKSKKAEEKKTRDANAGPSSSSTDSPHQDLQMPSPTRVSQNIAKSNVEPTIEHVPQLINDIETNDSSDKAARALRMLFSLSEHPSNNRIQMVQDSRHRLVPVLMNFLQTSDRGSSEQYLTLLVLNNISIPAQNKRVIALEHHGANILAKLLCDDPSCHLLAIILVNLSFCDAKLRSDLSALVSSMAYSLKLSSMTTTEFENHEDVGEFVEEKLQSLVLQEQSLRPALSDLDYNNNARGRGDLLLVENQVYPETARWCLAALKNLTRPPSTLGAKKLVVSGVVPLIMRIVTVGAPKQSKEGPVDENTAAAAASYSNPTTAWDSNSMQDAALFVILNLSATIPESVKELDGVRLLSLICKYSGDGTQTVDQEHQIEFQSIKAKMGLSFLLGATGHFGQLRGNNTTASYINKDDSVLLLSVLEAESIVELLANTLQNRAKEGPGGYSAATFHVKWVLFSIRCLLTHSTNQLRFAMACGPRLNTLLMKALAEHSMKNSTLVDAEAAEYAAFSLYLQSNYGFKTQFLPAFYGNDDKIKGTGSLAAKVLTSYIHMKSITPAGRHAADQLLLRLKYMHFTGSVAELASSAQLEHDYAFDKDLLESAESIIVEKRSSGAKPDDGIFDRPILRSRAPKKGSRAPWGDRSVRVFPSALHAVQELSFGSSRVRHMDAIDDIIIANNIFNSANGEKTNSYNYWWSWQDAAGGIQKNLEQIMQSTNSTDSISSDKRRSKQQDLAPMSIFGMSCCSADTTKFD